MNPKDFKTEFKNWLEEKNLSQYSHVFKDLGIYSFGELKHLEIKDFEESQEIKKLKNHQKKFIWEEIEKKKQELASSSTLSSFPSSTLEKGVAAIKIKNSNSGSSSNNNSGKNSGNNFRGSSQVSFGKQSNNIDQKNQNNFGAQSTYGNATVNRPERRSK